MTVTTTTIAPVKKTVRVKAPIAHAFDVFTNGFSRWWPQDRGIGKQPIARVTLEPHLGGRWIQVADDGAETLVATIIHWEPPKRVVLIWQINSRWEPDPSMRSEVDVTFTADGPDATVVELLHHKFETMGSEAGVSLRGDVDRGWPTLIDLYVREAERS